MAEHLISSITYRDDTYLLKNAVLMRKTFENIIATVNDVDNATFYFGKIVADSWDTPLRIRYRVKAYCPANKNYNQYADVSYFIIRNTAAYCVENVVYSTSYRAAYYHNLYRANQTGATVYGHLLGESLYASTNPLDTNLKRTFEFEILEIENCTFEFFESPVLYKNAPGTGSTNYTGRVDYSFSSSGLYPDSNTVTQTRIDSRLVADTNGVKQYSIIYETKDGKVESLTSSSGTGSKTWNIDAKIPYPPRLFYYAGSSNVNSGSNTGTGATYINISTIDMRYSDNISTTVGYTINKPLYLECDIDTDGYFTIDKNPYKQTFTKGKYYIFMGWVHTSVYQLSLMNAHTVYYYDGIKFIPVEQKFADDKYLPLTGGTITGDLVVKSNSGTNGFYVSRLGSTTQESVKHWVDDSCYHIDYTNDETASNIRFTMVNTDTESGEGASASTQHVVFSATKDGSTVSATNFSGKGSGLTNLNASNISSGTLSADRLATSGVTAGSYGPSANASPDHGGTFSVPYVTVDNKGRVTAASTQTITLPASDNTDEKVAQTNSSGNADYRILFSENANDTTSTEGARKNTNLKYNPSSKILYAPSLYGDNAKFNSTVYNITHTIFRGTSKEIVIQTGIKWVSSTHMPVVHLYGYAYGLQSPIELKIGFYIYSNNIGWCGATNMGAWKPDIYLFKYIPSGDSQEYVAIGLVGSINYPQYAIDVQDEMGGLTNINKDSNVWKNNFYTESGGGNIPTPNDGVTCIKVPYKQILSPAGNLKFKAGSTDVLTYDGSNSSDQTLTIASGDLNGQVKVNTSNVTVYTHPSYTAASSGLYKVTVDATGHVSATTAVVKADITSLGIPGGDTNTTYTLSGAYGTNNDTWVTTLTPSSGSATTSTVPKGTTSVYGLMKLSDSTSSTSTSLAATANAVKSAYDLANGKSTVSISRNLTSGTKIGTITIDGTATDLYCQTDTNTDTKVRQSLSTVNEKHPILMGYSQTSDTTANVDNVSYRNNSVYVNPSTGTVGATEYSVNAKVTMKYDTSIDAVKFVFS